MNRLSSQNQLIIAGVVLVLITVVVVMLGIMPLFQEASDLDSRIADAETQINSAKALLARRQSAKARAAANQLELMRIANQVPEAPELPSLIVDLQDAANEAGLEFVQVSVGDPGAPTPEASYSEVPIEVILEGDWTDTIEFLRRLDALMRGVRVQNGTCRYVAIEDAEAGTSDEFIETTLLVKAYFATPTEKPAAPTAPLAPPASAPTTGQ
ncbi:MAG: hypothetical protein Kow0067_05240 [Coriobacteriia bacterium]